MKTKTLSARDILNSSHKETDHKICINDNGEIKDAALSDIFGSKLIEQGKLNKNTAYEIREGKGLLRKSEIIAPTIIKVNIVALDPQDNEIKRDVGYTYTVQKSEQRNNTSIERARQWVSKERDRLIKLANTQLIKENREKLKQELEK